MKTYIIKRILGIFIMMLGVTFIVFTIVNITPGDPARQILGISATQEAVDQLNHELGYDQPFFTRYFHYMKDIVTRFDFGNSYKSGEAVVKEISVNFIYTFRLTIMGIGLYALIGIPLGILSAVKQYTAVDNIMRVMAMIIAAFPGFWLSMLLILIFSLYLGWVPSSGVGSWQCYILPLLGFAIPSSASLLRLTRTTMLETIRQDYVRTARAKGASERTVIWQHAFKNAMLPIIMTVGINIGVMMGGTIVTETVFSMPGLGSLAYNALLAKDVPLLMGTTIFLSFIFCVIVLLVDIISAYVDPRVKIRYINK